MPCNGSDIYFKNAEILLVTEKFAQKLNSEYVEPVANTIEALPELNILRITWFRNEFAQEMCYHFDARITGFRDGYEHAHFTQIKELNTEVERLTNLIDTPHTDDFLSAVKLEAAHQIKRWGNDHDNGKTVWDWFWLIGYLAQKAAQAAIEDNDEKAKHHTISTAAALFNWWKRLMGIDVTFQPGVDALTKEDDEPINPTVSCPKFG